MGPVASVSSVVADQAKAYLQSELWILAWGASVQRAKLFTPGSTESQRRTFRNLTIAWYETSLLPTYRRPVDADQHYRQLQTAVQHLSGLGRGLLGPDGYRLGVAQKALNLVLKYHWCLGLIPEPPHCPIDRIILQRTSLAGRLNWTQMTAMASYQQAMQAIEAEAGRAGLSIARWELQVYDRRAETKG